MSDSAELSVMRESTNYIKEDLYNKIIWRQVADQQGGVYDQGVIEFDTASFGSSNIVLGESYLSLPLKFSVAAPGKLAVKNSILSFIGGLQVQSSGGGVTVLNETDSTSIMNNLRLLLDSNTDYYDSNELMYFGKDQLLTNDGTAGSCGSGVTTGVAGIDPLHNPALASRIAVFASRATPYVADGVTATSGYYTYIAQIPLKFLHTFFEQMCFPIPNLGLKITFRIAGTSNYPAVFPLTCPSSAAGLNLSNLAYNSATSTVSAAAAAVPAIAKPGVSILVNGTDQFGFSTKPSLWLKTIMWNGDDGAREAARVIKGYDHIINYSVSQYRRFNMSAASFSETVTPTIKRPTRCWLFALPTGTLASEQNAFPSSISPNILTNLQLKISGTEYFTAPRTSQYSMYKDFREQLSGDGKQFATPISFDDWCNGMNPYVIDMSRDLNAQSDASLSLIVEGTVKDRTGADIVGNYDLHVVTELTKTVRLDVTQSGVAIFPLDGPR